MLLNYLKGYLITTILTTTFYFSAFNSFSQTVMEERVATFLTNNNYIDALKVLETLFEQTPDNIEYNYQISICYLNIYGDKTRAIPHLEYIKGKKTPDSEIYYALGLAYQYANRLDDALTAFQTSKKTANKKLMELIDRNIEQCFNGKELLKAPVNVTISNLGSEFNSEYPEYYPLIPKGESFMVFAARRSDRGAATKELDGYFSSDIYVSTAADGIWGKPKPMPGRVNTNDNEQAVFLSEDGEKFILYVEKMDSVGNIYLSTKNKGKLDELNKFPSNINQDFVSSGSMNENENQLFFSSKKSGGFGGADIYVSQKLPNGQWGEPLNLGPQINTKYNEDFPKISADGKLLYFASEGHNSMGGFDIFKSLKIKSITDWSAPSNLGFPINDAYDNMNISFSYDSSTAYMSRISPKGGLDIFKVKFNDNESRYRIIRGEVTFSDSTVKLQDLKIVIYADNEELPIIFKYRPNKNSGRYIMALPPGEFNIKAVAEDFEENTFKLKIFDVPYQSEFEKNIILTPLKK